MQSSVRCLLTPALGLVLATLVALIALPTPTIAQEGAHGGAANDSADNLDIHAPSEAVRAPRITQVWAEPGVSTNPISLTFDSDGNLYVAEAWRAGNAVLAIVWEPLRESNSLEDDLQMTRVEDRAAHIERLVAGGFYPREQFTGQADKVRFVQDTDGDGKADRSTIFADGFNNEVDGTAASVLWHEGKVYLANIPNLWLLDDKDGDGDADKTTPGERTSMSYGYGLRWGYSGHDLHGLIKAHDGRIYFSIGDRGYNVTNQEGEKLYSKSRGAVFRMWPDGSGLEVFYRGLRNPQELAFDNYGNLFTGDNNCDAGDLARFCYLPEGGDTGWNQDVQSLPHRGPWLREKMWELRGAKDDPAQPAWIIPPLAHVGRGPSGLAHYPGTGDAFAANGSFLMCDYPPGVRHVQIKPHGADFAVTEDSTFVDGQPITDIAWGYDGRLYLADWGGGWIANDRGYLKTMVNAKAHEEQSEVIKQVQSLFANGFGKLNDDALIELLGHRDQRVRLEAQWEAANRAPEPALVNALQDENGSELKRLHALWAMGMASRQTIDYVTYIMPLLEDTNANLRAQAASVLGDLGYAVVDKYIALLNDESPIVQHHAAIALGKTAGNEAIGPLLELLARNDNNDVVIRHAASYALSLIGDANAIHNDTKQYGSAARLGAVLALRRLDSPLIADYLQDDDALVAAEAARAIYDKRIMDALPALAALSDALPAERMIEPVMRRVIEANVRLADQASAMRLGRLAANADAPEMWRTLALEELETWSAQRNREGVWGTWWPRETQTMDYAVAAFRSYLPDVIEQSAGKLQALARTLQLRHVANVTPDQLAAMITHADEPAELRIASIVLLAENDKARAVELAVQLAKADDFPVDAKRSLRERLLELDIEAALDSYLYAARHGEMAERQQAVRQLGRMQRQEADAMIAEFAAELGAGTLSPELRLDVFTAISRNANLSITTRAAATKYEERHKTPGEEPFVRDAVLAGGSIEAGKQIFLHNDAAQCLRCHTVGGGATVGPDLAAIGSMHDATYLYYALVIPHANIAQGFATSTIKLKSGEIKTGRIVQSTPAKYVIANSDGQEEMIARDQVIGMPATSDQSMMPTMTDKLTAYELRHVIAYLVSLKGDGTQSHNPSLISHGPQLINPAKGLNHMRWLPGILLGISVGLGALLLLTVLGSTKVR